MSLMLRRVRWADGKLSADLEDYGVYDGDRLIGWIYRTNSTGSQRWGWGIDFAMGKGKHGGLVDSLDDAKAAFKAVALRRNRGKKTAIWGLVTGVILPVVNCNGIQPLRSRGQNHEGI